jgi:UDP-N-acetyl-D-mannosaminuronate dehydrogenase
MSITTPPDQMVADGRVIGRKFVIAPKHHRPQLGQFCGGDWRCPDEPRSAELIKHTSNAFLAMKISFINAIANISESVGADIEQIDRRNLD